MIATKLKLRVWFEAKGYGFLDGDFGDSGVSVRKSVYFHATSIRRGLPLPGATVTSCRVVDMPRGLRAHDVVFAPCAAEILLDAKMLQEKLEPPPPTRPEVDVLAGGNR
jgi:cold shock CspA family protein